MTCLWKPRLLIDRAWHAGILADAGGYRLTETRALSHKSAWNRSTARRGIAAAKALRLSAGFALPS